MKKMEEIDGYKLQEKIESDQVSETFLAIKNKKKYAVQKIEKKKLQEQRQLLKYFNNCHVILQKLKNVPNIQKLEEIKQNKEYFYYVYEYCNGGTLSELLEKYKEKFHKPFDEKIVQILFKQIINAVKKMHYQKISHGNLTSDCILVHFDNEKDKTALNMEKAQIKISKFYLATYSEEGNLRESMMSQHAIEPNHLLKINRLQDGETVNARKTDIWNLGLLCYELLCGSLPFDTDDYCDFLDKLRSGDIKITKSMQSSCDLSIEAVSFLNAMLRYDPKKRLEAEHLIEHPFLQENTKLHTGLVGEGDLNIWQSIMGVMQQDNFKTKQDKFKDLLAAEDEEDKKKFDNYFNLVFSSKNPGTPKTKQSNKNTTNTTLDSTKMTNMQERPELGLVKNTNDNTSQEEEKKEEHKNEEIIIGNFEKAADFVLDENMRIMLNDIYQKVNSDIVALDPMLLPVIPNTHPEFFDMVE